MKLVALVGCIVFGSIGVYATQHMPEGAWADVPFYMIAALFGCIAVKD
ncbi:hypothetical protein [Burkholderia phage vB_BpP_HN03]